MSGPPTKLTPFGNALAGAFGACIANALVYPLDTVKTKIQASSSSPPSTSTTDSSISRPNAPQNISLEGISTRKQQAGINDIIRKIWREQGLGGFYRGFGASMMNTFSMQFAYFYWYTIVRTTYLLRFPSKKPSTPIELLLGALAGALAQIFTIPVSVVATRQQLEEGKDGKGLWETVREIVRSEGVPGLWSGLKASLVLTVNPAITYGVFERLRSIVTMDGGKLGPYKAFMVGAGSKSLATVVTYPYIMAKVRLQAKSKGKDEKKELLPLTTTNEEKSVVRREKSPGAVGLLMQVARREGLGGWYRGMQAQLLKATLTQALLFGIKDILEGYTLLLMIFLYKARHKIAIKTP